MAGALAQPPRHLDSERLRRRRDRQARLATDRALAEVAFGLRPRHRQGRGPDRGGVARALERHGRIQSS
jgi:hypothetical protein